MAFTQLAQWYDKVEKAGHKSFNTAVRSIQNHYQTIPNFFDNRSTNASAEASMPGSKPLEGNSEG